MSFDFERALGELDKTLTELLNSETPDLPELEKMIDATVVLRDAAIMIEGRSLALLMNAIEARGRMVLYLEQQDTLH